MAVLKKSKRSQKRVTPPSKKKVVAKAKPVVVKPKKTAASPKKTVKSPKKAVIVAKPVVARTKTVPALSSQNKSKGVPQQPLAGIVGVQMARVTLRKDVIPVSTKPTAQTCPLVLDRIILEEDFSPKECFSCDEFDCRFYVAEERSGSLGGRLFAVEAGDEEEDDWDLSEGEGEEPEGDDEWGGEDDQ
jgi:hypothetical protein